MGMFDTIGSEQVKCFDNLLKEYNIGDVVPTDRFGYEKNLIILPFGYRTYGYYWRKFKYIIIKDSKVFELKDIGELNDNDFNETSQVISYNGVKFNIKSLNDLFNYIEDVQMIAVKEEINEVKGVYIDLYEDLHNKWTLK